MTRTQGIRRPQLPAAPPAYNQREEQRFRGLLHQQALEIHGRFLNDAAVVVEAWGGGPLVVVGAEGGPTSYTSAPHTVAEMSRNGVYLLDVLVGYSPARSTGEGPEPILFHQNVRTTVELDRLGDGDWEEVATYTWGMYAPQSAPQTLTFSHPFLSPETSQVRLVGYADALEQPGGDEVSWSLTITPLRLRGQ